jgi:drug/metabolite transporter (DMT)-like permease
VNMRRFYILGFAVLVLFDTVTQVSFKLATIHAGEFSLQASWLQHVLLSFPIYGAILGYLGSFVTWMTLLRHAPIGPAFAASHLEIISVLLISYVFFGEHLNPIQLIGAASIVLGVAFLGMSKGGPPDA